MLTTSGMPRGGLRWAATAAARAWARSARSSALPMAPPATAPVTAPTAAPRPARPPRFVPLARGDTMLVIRPRKGLSHYRLQGVSEMNCTRTYGRRPLAALLVAALVLAAPAARAGEAPKAKKVVTVEGITEYK